MNRWQRCWRRLRACIGPLPAWQRRFLSIEAGRARQKELNMQYTALSTDELLNRWHSSLDPTERAMIAQEVTWRSFTERQSCDDSDEIDDRYDEGYDDGYAAGSADDDDEPEPEEKLT
jgi:hypothetical protein